MNTVNTALFILVWTFTAVCRADKDINVTCDNVTGSVGKEVYLTCKVSLQNTDCCIKNYKFQYPESLNDSTICKPGFFPESPCEQRKTFTCSYKLTTTMTERFRFFVQTICGGKTTKFTVNTKDPSLRKADGPEDTGSEDTGPEDTGSEDTGSKDTVISSVVGLLVIIILIIILMTFIYKKQYFRFPFLCIKHNEDSNCPENVI